MDPEAVAALQLVKGPVGVVSVSVSVCGQARQDKSFILNQGASSWLFIVPWGMRKSMNYLKNRYGNPPVIITENGIDEENEPHTSLQAALEDQKRIDYHRDYLSNLSAAINEDGCNVRGYFAWSLLDNWEWTSGFSVRFGLYFVDYNSPALTRYAKKSVEWFSDFLQPF